MTDMVIYMNLMIKIMFSKEKIEEIKKEYPSICYSCEHSRRPASDENTQIGYVGCVLRCIDKDYTEIVVGDTVAEGWVDLRSDVFGNKSGVMTNYQLLTHKIKKCNSFIKK